MFRRIYGEATAPKDGFSFADPQRPVPAVYRLSAEGSAEETEMWRRFWRLATDPSAAREQKARVRQVSRSIATTLEEGRSYRVIAEAGGLMRIREVRR